jgi:hypothetical protein
MNYRQDQRKFDCAGLGAAGNGATVLLVPEATDLFARIIYHKSKSIYIKKEITAFAILGMPVLKIVNHFGLKQFVVTEI